jgi:D-3-phosphoglycerate dehydrogenase / 2-oxoglutarate reductase
MPTVLITSPVFMTRDIKPLAKLEAAGWTVRHEPEGTHADEDRLIELLAGVDATVAGGEPYTRRVLKAATSLKHVARWGVGFDRVDLTAATELGVLVTTTQGGNDWGVADHAFAMILGLGHLLVENHLRIQSGEWGWPVGTDVWRKTLGIIGLGRIGKAVALRASAFEMRVLAYEPYPDRAFCKQWGIKLLSLDELLQRSDYVTLHIPGGGKNGHLIGRAQLSLMKSRAYLVNTARGDLIDEDALYDALVKGTIAGAGLDVRATEPPGDPRFNSLPNVILSPHVAGVTHDTVSRMSHLAVDSILSAQAGEEPHGLLNPAAWDRRRPY